MTSPTIAEFGLDTLVHLDDDFTVAAMLRQRAADNPDRPYCEYKDGSGAWVTVTLAEFEAKVNGVAKGIVALGVKPGQTVGLMASTRFEWAVMDFAIMVAGALTVPIYPSSSAGQIEWIATDAKLQLIVVETARQQQLAESISNAPPVLAMDGDPGAVAHLEQAGAKVTDAALAKLTKDQRLDDVASLVYTSGTTGNPKGVALTHRNCVEHAVNAYTYPDLHDLTSPERRILLFLPLAHVLARHLELLTLASGMTLGFAPSPATLAGDLQGFKPNWMLAVPRVLEAFYNTVSTRAGGGIKGRLFAWAAGMSRRASEAREAGRLGPLLKAKLAIADALVLKKVRAAMGGQMKYIVCGGAKLSPSLAHFYSGLGVTVLEGYGLTETSAPATCNPQHAPRAGTVGLPLPGTTIRIADDGEVLIKGLGVFAGYHQRPDVTADVLTEDGWFASGDLGTLDADGYLSITGRKKEILVTSGGKNVQPAGLENVIRPDQIVQEVVVIGDGEAFVAALISLDTAMLKAWLKQRGLPDVPPTEAAELPDVKEHLRGLVKAANETVSKAEGIRTWRVLPRELSEAEGELTASLKVKRHAVMAHFDDVVRQIYKKGEEA